MFKSSQLVTFVQQMVGQPYWYGTCVYQCTNSLLSSKSKQYTSHYGSNRTARYKQDIANRRVCMDCIGMIKGFFWTNGGQGVLEYMAGGASYTRSYGSNSCPDKGANGMLTWLKSKGCVHGTIDTLPEVPGLLLFKSGHVGVYIGNGYAIEAQGFAYGVVKTVVAKRPWKEWSYLPSSMLEYDGEAPVVDPVIPTEPVTPTVYKLGDRTLQFSPPYMEGEDVKEMQTRLNANGYDCGKADGVFGKNTEKGVKAFQTAVNIEVDGKFGASSLAALNGNSAPQEAPEQSFITYDVQAGDSLWRIAKKYLGAGAKWKQIAELNALSNTVIHRGMTLKIPETKA